MPAGKTTAAVNRAAARNGKRLSIATPVVCEMREHTTPKRLCDKGRAFECRMRRNLGTISNIRASGAGEDCLMNRFFRHLSVVGLILLLPAAVAWAQATAGLAGRVTDESGAVLPGVTVTITQTDTGFTRSVVTDGSGAWIASNLPLGPYRLEVSLPGFRTFVQTGITLQVGSSPTLDVVLQIGQVSEQVEVEANAALVETRTSSIGQVVENERILDLPLNGRAVVDLVYLIGAATPAATLDGNGGRSPFSKGNVSIAGGMHTGVKYTLDGAYHQDPYTNGYMSLPFPDALQEF